MRIPKDACYLLGVGVGCPVIIDIDQAKSQAVLSFARQERTYSRNRKPIVSMFFDDHNPPHFQIEPLR